MDAALWGSGFVGLALVLALVLGAVFWAKRQDRSLRARQPHVLPFVWGYFWSAFSVIVSALAILWGLFGALELVHASVPPEKYWTAVAAGVLCLPVSWAASKRRRWGWALLTLISFNPLLWLLQTLYLSRRWHEMSTRLTPRDSGAPRSKVSVGVATEQTSIP